ncbi:23S rRNA (Adenine(2058)-N(6))-methyltransferase Erm(O) OS=Streptomyces tendae OX=1932 GN=erm(O)PE=3 SV=1 [Streptomyces tendae]
MARPTQRARTLSQNFLADRSTAGHVARLAAPDRGRPPLVVEVGAGKGALTEPLARRSRELHAYEIDPRLVPGLRARSRAARTSASSPVTSSPPAPARALLGGRERPVLPHGRHRRLVPDRTRSHRRHPPHPARVRPQTDRRLRPLESAHGPDLAAARMAAGGPGGPPPLPSGTARRAGILRLERRRTPLLTDAAARRTWADLVEFGFSGVGGSLHASLRRAHPRRRVDAAFRVARLDPGLLVGEVAPERWLRLHEELAA